MFTAVELFYLFVLVFGVPFVCAIAAMAEPKNKPNPNQFPYTARTDTGATGTFENLETVANWFLRLRAGSNPPEFVSATHETGGWVWELEFDEFAPDSIYLSKVDVRNSGDI